MRRRTVSHGYDVTPLPTVTTSKIFIFTPKLRRNLKKTSYLRNTPSDEEIDFLRIFRHHRFHRIEKAEIRSAINDDTLDRDEETSEKK
jgi:hypothetical protein